MRLLKFLSFGIVENLFVKQDVSGGDDSVVGRYPNPIYVGSTVSNKVSAIGSRMDFEVITVNPGLSSLVKNVCAAFVYMYTIPVGSKILVDIGQYRRVLPSKVGVEPSLQDLVW
jgi:hypothetical protein